MIFLFIRYTTIFFLSKLPLSGVDVFLPISTVIPCLGDYLTTLSADTSFKIEFREECWSITSTASVISSSVVTDGEGQVISSSLGLAADGGTFWLKLSNEGMERRGKSWRHLVIVIIAQEI
jgi:hypothetical protein